MAMPNTRRLAAPSSLETDYIKHLYELVRELPLQFAAEEFSNAKAAMLSAEQALSGLAGAYRLAHFEIETGSGDLDDDVKFADAIINTDKYTLKDLKSASQQIIDLYNRRFPKNEVVYVDISRRMLELEAVFHDSTQDEHRRHISYIENKKRLYLNNVIFQPGMPLADRFIQFRKIGYSLTDEEYVAVAIRLFPEVVADVGKQESHSIEDGSQISAAADNASIPLSEYVPVKWSIASRLKVESEQGARRETAVEFARRVYRRWLEDDIPIPRTKLRELDRPLLDALISEGNELGWPDDLARLFPKYATTSRQYARQGSTGAADLERWKTGLNKDGSEATFTKREANRLNAAASWIKNRQQIR